MKLLWQLSINKASVNTKEESWAVRRGYVSTGKTYLNSIFLAPEDKEIVFFEFLVSD